MPTVDEHSQSTSAFAVLRDGQNEPFDFAAVGSAQERGLHFSMWMSVFALPKSSSLRDDANNCEACELLALVPSLPIVFTSCSISVVNSCRRPSQARIRSPIAVCSNSCLCICDRKPESRTSCASSREDQPSVPQA